MKNILNEFFNQLKLEHNDKKLIIYTKYRLKKYFEYLEEYNLKVNEVRIKEAQNYQKWLIEAKTDDGQEYSKGTILNFIKAVIQFYNFLQVTFWRFPL